MSPELGPPNSLGQHEYHIPYSPNPIHCIYANPKPASALKAAHPPAPTPPSLIFTHGAGGTLNSEAIANFITGFSSFLPVAVFQGNMNLKSRVKMFGAVVSEFDNVTCLGGRSMGARAAVMAATELTTHLVLVSYPLHTDKEVRDQILLDIPPTVKVLFVSGDHDSMCDLGRLERVRDKMECETWAIVVRDADHGMNVKPKRGTKPIGESIGELVAQWLQECGGSKREGNVTWVDKEERVEWSGWFEKEDDTVEPGRRLEPPLDKGIKTKTKPETKPTAKRKLDHAEPDEKRASTRPKRTKKGKTN